MKHLLLTTIAAVLLVGCGESQQSVPQAEAKPAEPVAEVATPEPPTTKASDISIHDAAESGNLEAVKQHLAAGTDVEAWDDVNEQTPLHLAAFGGRKEIVELLISKGADVNAEDVDGWTPLDCAEAQNQTETANLLRKHGGKYGSIYEAARGGDIEAVKTFLAAGADLNAKDKIRGTPLHYAAAYDQKEIVELLIAAGADVNGKDYYGRTPLHYAAVNGRKVIVKLLIAEGADVNGKVDGGDTPLDWAKSKEHKETADLLRKHGGKTKTELEAEGK